MTHLYSALPILTRQGLPQPERLGTSNDIAITQMRTLLCTPTELFGGHNHE